MQIEELAGKFRLVPDPLVLQRQYEEVLYAMRLERSTTCNWLCAIGFVSTIALGAWLAINLANPWRSIVVGLTFFGSITVLLAIAGLADHYLCEIPSERQVFGRRL